MASVKLIHDPDEVMFNKLNRSSKSQGVEQCLNLTAPLDLDAEVKLISTPGHTKGHLVIHYKKKFLFTGDHIFFDTLARKPKASRDVCWYSWVEQTS